MEVAANPFDNDIASGPRPIPESVALNDNILDELILKFETRKDSSTVRQQLRAQLVLSSEPGYGKSHLIGRLFGKLSQRATLVYLTPFVNSSTYWKTILRKTVQELKYNDNLDSKVESYTQLEAFAHGILVNLIESGINSGKIRTTTKKAILDFLHNKNILEFRAAKKMLTFVQKNIGGLEKIFINELKRKGIVLNVISESSWFRVLFTYAYLSVNNNITDACLAWLNGEGIDAEEAKQIGIRKSDIPSNDISSGEINELSKERILDLCMLATFYRPFVFCFDQTENYLVDKGLIDALGSVIQVLVDGCYNQMTVITANRQPWGIIKGHLQVAYQDRIETLQLKGINRQQASELIELRFTVTGSNDPEKKNFIGDGTWLAEMFQQASEIGIRSFIQACKERFGKVPPITIEALYIKSIEKRKSQPKSLVFDENILNWLVYNAARGIPGLTIGKFNGNNNYFTVQWKLNGWYIYFGFEDGSNVSRWQAITKSAQRLYQDNRNTKVVLFRTHELSPIPGRGWIKSAPIIEAAKRQCLHILQLQPPNKDPMIIELYAAYDLYSEAVSEDIPFTPEQVLNDAFVRKVLQRFWDIIIAPIVPITPIKVVQPTPSQPAPSHDDLEAEIRRIVEDERFMHIDDLIKKLSTPVSRETCLQICQRIPQIRVTDHPQMVLIQWQ
ncbi:MAG: hypothetical protein HQL03_04360 [Nitrospirae bacterium]|nr:hypothetical protein [Nitrospirota bacterium]MBF0592362.1 hypothetical protein [Nitrospirota bacterium]